MDDGLADVEDVDRVIGKDAGEAGTDAGAVGAGHGNEDDFAHAGCN